ncbi:olfactory receptor 7G1-like [Ochotona princeps]|uniref:olfactory receptor 7G1-like n=1 Tax=Ochotona princeps TaxID=9978 RepID=UPI002714FA8F|nr:olfactory receptor 7G1-like [Ochotona princeps]
MASASLPPFFISRDFHWLSLTRLRGGQRLLGHVVYKFVAAGSENVGGTLWCFPNFFRAELEWKQSCKEFNRLINTLEAGNRTAGSQFFLLGLTDDPALQPLLFGLFLCIYLVTVLGNLLIILAVCSDAHLHTPMYFFLGSLSFTDIWISSTTVPKMLTNLRAGDHGITYAGCLTQICFVLILGGFESCLLAVMAYDRYVAICQPLRYTVVMSPRLCVLLVLLSLCASLLNALLHCLMVLRLVFCTHLEIRHFFCELVPVIRLACSDPLVNQLLIYFVTSLFAGIPLSGIIFSYGRIVSSVLRMRSARGRHKAFSTCGAHLSVVSLFYGTAFGVYMSSTVAESSVGSVVASMMYIVVPQMMNPFIYSLRNRDMKGALRTLVCHLHCACVFGRS